MSSIEDFNKFLLSEEQHEAIFQNEIKPYLFSNLFKSEKPTLVIFGGQPGSGKSAAVEHAEKEFKIRGGSVSILGDDLRAFHPEYEHLLAVDDKTAAFYTGQDSGKWVEKAIDYAKQLRCHVVIEGTMRSPQTVERTINAFRRAGYWIDARILAVNKRLSWQGILQRYEHQRAYRGSGRMTLPNAHQEAYDGLLTSINKIEIERLVDNIIVYQRGGLILYENKLQNNDWEKEPLAVKTVEKERNREWTLPEKVAYEKGFDQILRLLKNPERQATQDEILTVESLKKQAHQLIEISENKEVPSNYITPEEANSKSDTPRNISPEEETFIDILLQYKKLKQEEEQCPYPSIKPLLNADLVAHTITMSKNQALMNYIQLRFPKMMKNIKSISQSISQSQSLSIDLDR